MGRGIRAAEFFGCPFCVRSFYSFWRHRCFRVFPGSGVNTILQDQRPPVSLDAMQAPLQPVEIKDLKQSLEEELERLKTLALKIERAVGAARVSEIIEKA